MLSSIWCWISMRPYGEETDQLRTQCLNEVDLGLPANFGEKQININKNKKLDRNVLGNCPVKSLNHMIRTLILKNRGIVIGMIISSFIPSSIFYWWLPGSQQLKWLVNPPNITGNKKSVGINKQLTNLPTLKLDSSSQRVPQWVCRHSPQRNSKHYCCAYTLRQQSLAANGNDTGTG